MMHCRIILLPYAVLSSQPFVMVYKMHTLIRLAHGDSLWVLYCPMQSWVHNPLLWFIRCTHWYVLHMETPCEYSLVNYCLMQLIIATSAHAWRSLWTNSWSVLTMWSQTKRNLAWLACRDASHKTYPDIIVGACCIMHAILCDHVDAK
jgi:hypothetical protein